MTNKVRVVDVLKYANEKYKLHEAKYKETLRIHNDLIEKARNNWFYKKFPYFFNPNDHGLSIWDTAWFSVSATNRFKELINQATYMHKCNHEYMIWSDKISLSEDNFYAWCMENNIPY